MRRCLRRCRLLSSGGGPVLVLGATNRPFDLDTAVLRRFSLQLEVGAPC